MNERGFTLLEIILAITIGLAVLVLTVVAFRSANSSQALDKSAQLIVSALNEARTLSLSSKDASVYGVHIKTTEVILFKGTTFTEGAETNKQNILNGEVSVTDINLNNGGSSVVFSRLRGDTDNFGTITLSNVASTSSKTINISRTGNIEIAN